VCRRLGISQVDLVAGQEVTKKSADIASRSPHIRLRVIAYTLVDDRLIRSRQLSVFDAVLCGIDDRGVAPNIGVYGQLLRKTLAKLSVCDCHNALQFLPTLYGVNGRQRPLELVRAFELLE